MVGGFICKSLFSEKVNRFLADLAGKCRYNCFVSAQMVLRRKEALCEIASIFILPTQGKISC